jgi:hypothetical protein
MVQTAWMRNVSEIWWDQDPRYAKTKSRWNMVKPTKYCWTWYCIILHTFHKGKFHFVQYPCLGPSLQGGQSIRRL